MKVDINRVNLLERDIEEWLYENPAILDAIHGTNPIEQWIGRQYQLPSGIADLIGVRQDGTLVVVEVKNVAINKAAVLQVCRYAEDLKYIVSNRMDYPHKANDNEPWIEMILAGPSIDTQTFTEAQAVGVRVFQFSAQLTLNVSSMRWTNEFRNEVRDRYESIASRPEWAIYGETIEQHIDRCASEERLAYELDHIVHSEWGPPSEGYSDIILNETEEE